MIDPGRVRPARMRYVDAILGTLRGAGFSAEMTDHAYHALDSHILGSTLWLAGITAGSQALAAPAETFLEQLPLEDYPWLGEHIDQHRVARPPGDPSEFEFGLGLILDGLERVGSDT
jgi:hypothetical protein